MNEASIIKSAFLALGALGLIALLLAATPFLFILSTNTLFGAHLSHGFWQYFAFWVLAFTVRVTIAPVVARS